MNKECSLVRLELSNKINVGCYVRNRDEATTSAYLIRKNHIVGNPADEFIDLSESLLNEAKKETL